MTNKEASEILDDYDINFDGHSAEVIAEAFDVAFKALEQEPKADPSKDPSAYCEDAISRREAILQIQRYGVGTFDSDDFMPEVAERYVIGLLKKLPSVQPAPIECDDAISRQAVLEYIEASDAELGHSSENELVCQDIKEMPPVTLQSKMEQWIPVSEKPKEEGSYMTTLDYGEYGLSAGQRYYHGEDYGWSDVCVIAWMPLPKPYKPQERKNG